MNKKLLIAIIALVAALAVLLVFIMTQSGKKPPQADAPQPTSGQIQTDAPEIPDVTEGTQAPTEAEMNPDEPDPSAQDQPTEPTRPAESTEPTTEPKDDPAPTAPGNTQQPTTGGNTGTVEVPTVGAATYETYIAMSGEQQQAFIDQFDSVAEFVNWYNAAKAEYDAAHPDIEIGSDTIIDGSQLGKN